MRAAVDVSVLAGVDGIAGSLVDHLEIEAGAEAAVAAALGEAMHAIVVEGDDAARQAVRAHRQRRRAGAAARARRAWTTAVTMGATLAPEGAKALAACVRAPLPGLQATLTRLLAGVVLAEGDWRAAVDLAIENPDLTVMTPSGDRFGGRGLWRLGGEQVSGITRAALQEAEDRAVRRGRRPHRGRGGRRRGADRGRRGTPSGRGGLGVRRELEMRAATLDERRDVLTRRLAGVEDRLARDPEAKAAAERYRSALVAKEQSYGEVADRLDEQSGRIDAVLERLRGGAAAPGRAGQRSRAASSTRCASERSGLEHELAGTRERQQRRDVEEAENRMRLEAVVERIRTDFDCEPAVALDAPAPEPIEGTTWPPGRGTSTASCGSWARSTRSRSRSTTRS